MRSTELIHEIIEEFGDEDNRDLMRSLKELRLQIAFEVRKAVLKQYDMNKRMMINDYDLLVKAYR